MATFKQVYIPIDAIERHEDFECWYEDDFTFCTCTSDWKDEKSRVRIIGYTGGQIAHIKPDYKALNYDVGVDRWTYTLRTHVIFKHYFFEGMLWQMHGSISNNHAYFINEDSSKKDVYIDKVKDFKGHGPCYQVRVKDISKLRAAAAVTIAMMIKEYYKGLSEGEPLPEKVSLKKRIQRNLMDKGYSYEAIQENPDIVN